jgi:CHASE2 domain-containing sensor protein
MPKFRPAADRQPMRSPVGARWLRRLGVSLAIVRDPDAERIRTVTLGWLFAAGFALLGLARYVPGAGLLGESPFDLDQALRTVTAGWFGAVRTRPVTLVDIDVATYAAWHSPLVTPRADLARLLRTITDAEPGAVVVDVHLPREPVAPVAPAAAAADTVLSGFLRDYRGAAPLIFPRRLEIDADGRRWETRSAYDAVVATNPRLHWAHASFATSGGVVRNWQRWLEVCTSPADEPAPGAEDIVVAQTRWLPAIAELLAEPAAPGAPAESQPAPAAASGDCREEAPGAADRLLIGPRLSGDAAAPSTGAMSISAGLLLEPGLQVDTGQLFTGRTVLLGATHPAARDYWLTTGGVLPGVELIANTVRYLDVQGPASRNGWARRAVALVFFAFFAVATWRLRGLPKLVVLIAGTLLLVAVAITAFHFYAVFDALEAAIVLTVLYKAAVELCNVIEDARHHWRENRGRSRRLLRTLKAVSTRQA